MVRFWPQTGTNGGVRGEREGVGESSDAFRRVNDRLAGRARELDEAGPTPFLCECADVRCTRIVLLTLEEYADVRSEDGRYVIVPGHRLPGDQRIIATGERYWITGTGRTTAGHTPASA